VEVVGMSALDEAFRVYSCEECHKARVFGTFNEFKRYVEDHDIDDRNVGAYDLRDYYDECERCGRRTRWWA
jgi:hypothetical protein